MLDARDDDARRAVLALLRSVLASDLDSATVIFGVNQIVPSSAYRSALDGLAPRESTALKAVRSISSRQRPLSERNLPSQC
jgi:hypothetical protein